MMRLTALLAEHWLVVLLLLAGGLGAARLALRRRNAFAPPFGLLAATVLCFLLAGGYFLGQLRTRAVGPGEAAFWMAVAGAGGLFLMVAGLVATGRWSLTLAAGLGGVLCFGVGGLAVVAAQAGGVEAVRALRSIEFVQPYWLLLLLLLPAVVDVGLTCPRVLGPTRGWVAVAARCVLVAALALALAEPRIRHASENVTVLFVVDRSLSVPQEIDPTTADSSGGAIDRRWQRIQHFINETVQRRGPAHRNDQTGVIFFGRQPRLVMPASAVDKLLVSDALAGPLDPNYTNIAGALKLAMASFPEGTSRRVVLISDGNENLGSAEEQANIARQNGVQIDTIPLAVGYRNENEVLIQSVEAPPQAARGQRVPVRVLVRNANPGRLVYGTLELLQVRDGNERPVPIQDSIDVIDSRRSPALVRLRPGLNAFTFRDKPEDSPKQKNGNEVSYTYRAAFVPIETRNLQGGDPVAGLPGDRTQNNRAITHVIARGQRRVLFLEEGAEDGGFIHQHLIDELRKAKFSVAPFPVTRLPRTKDAAAVFLSNYDCVVIADVPSELLNKEQQEAIQSNTRDQGCGLVFVGGPNSYGAGGYQKTPIEATLPVDCEIKAMKAAGKGGLVLIMHASEMADGNKWQKEIAKLAIQRLSAVDMVGVLYYDFNVRWHVPFQQVGADKGRLLAMVDRMTPGDMPDFDPFLKAAYDTLSDPQHGLATKHVILISDGDPSLGAIGRKALADMARPEAAITCTTVGVATHGMPENNRMQEIADSAYNSAERKGKFYNVNDPSKLPAIYIKESRRVSQSFLYTQRFNPKLRLRGGPTDKLEDPLPDLYGFVRTTMKASPLAEMEIEGPPVFDQKFPILASWQYGLGRAVAFTSDAKSLPPNVEGWDRAWAGSEMYRKFWEQVVAWAMRGPESDRLSVVAEYRDGRVKVTVEARDPETNKPLTDLRIDGAVTVPGTDEQGAHPIELQFEQRAAGVYEAEFKAEEAGSYIINARARQLVPKFPDGKPRYKGRFKDAVPTTVTERGGKLFLEDGTEVRHEANGTLVYADDGSPVVVEDKVEKVIDSRRSAVSLSYSPEFADLESNTNLLRTLSRITGGNVYSEDPAELAKLAQSGELYRAGPPVVRSLQPIWYWLVLLAGVGLLFDVGVRRISLEPAELTNAASRLWAKLRGRRERAADETEAEFLARLRRRKEQAGESLDRGRAARRFEPTASAPASPPPPGADTLTPPATAPPPTGAPPPTTPSPRPAEEPEDFFSKLRKAKRRAPHERRREDEPGAPS